MFNRNRLDGADGGVKLYLQVGATLQGVGASAV
jgi:hypothetical protein